MPILIEALKKKLDGLKVFKFLVGHSLAIMLHACCMHLPGWNRENLLSFRLFFGQAWLPYGTRAMLHTDRLVNT